MSGLLAKENSMTNIDKGCQCACHEFPEHSTVQDYAEALRWHQEKLASIVEDAAKLKCTKCAREVPFVNSATTGPFTHNDPSGWTVCSAADIRSLKPSSSGLLVRNLSMLVRRLCRSHPDKKLTDAACKYLMGKGLEGSILRNTRQDKKTGSGAETELGNMR